MAITKRDDGLICEDFYFEHQYGTFRDAIIMAEEEYNALSPEEIAAIKKQRFDAWIAFVETPAEAIVETVEEPTTLDEQLDNGN